MPLFRPHSYPSVADHYLPGADTACLGRPFFHSMSRIVCPAILGPRFVSEGTTTTHVKRWHAARVSNGPGCVHPKLTPTSD